MPENRRIRWLRFVVIACLCAMMLVIGLNVEPLTIQFHRKMRFWTHSAHAAGCYSSDTQATWLLGHEEWHRDRLVDHGYLTRHVLTFHSALPPTERSSMIKQLYATMGQDCMWFMGMNPTGRAYIEIYAPQPELERHMALVESHDIAPDGDRSSQPSSE